MRKIGIFYSFNTVKTAKIAETIREAFGEAEADLVNVEQVSTEQFRSYDNIICGTSTWFDGELPNYWDEFVPDLEDMDLSDKTIALFGLGDQKGYPENFLDGVGLLGEILIGSGARLVGFTSVEGYSFESSCAVKNDRFIGLAIDFENQAAMNADRINNWVEQLKTEFT
jgi:flavodoxin I